MNLPITTLYGSLLVLVTLLLAGFTSLYRLRHRVFVGDVVSKELHSLVRAHGNSAEWLAPTVLLIFFLEVQRATPGPLRWLAGGMLLARLLHSTLMILGTRVMLAGTRGTVFSATVMYLLVFAMAGWALWLRLH